MRKREQGPFRNKAWSLFLRFTLLFVQQKQFDLLKMSPNICDIGLTETETSIIPSYISYYLWGRDIFPDKICVN